MNQQNQHCQTLKFIHARDGSSVALSAIRRLYIEAEQSNPEDIDEGFDHYLVADLGDRKVVVELSSILEVCQEAMQAIERLAGGPITFITTVCGYGLYAAVGDYEADMLNEVIQRYMGVKQDDVYPRELMKAHVRKDAKTERSWAE